MAETKDNKPKPGLDELPTLADLPGDLQLIAEVIGVEATVALARRFGGTGVYIPKLLGHDRRTRDKMIREEFDRRTGAGESSVKVVNEIARREAMPGSRQVWNILTAPDDRQMGLFG